MATKQNETNETSTEVFDAKVLETQLRLLAGKIKSTTSGGNDEQIIGLKNYIVKVRTMMGSGGRFDVEKLGKDGSVEKAGKAECGIPVGITALFDANVDFARKNGVTEITTIIDRNGRGKKAAEVLSADSITV